MHAIDTATHSEFDQIFDGQQQFEVIFKLRFHQRDKVE